jgi:23S rRNA pseudouridine1911/1915/1917 synthase
MNMSASSFGVVHESDEYAVVEKPPFLLVHPTKPGGPRTLWSELRQLFAYEIANGGQVSIVNRLDRETSGLILVAKSARAARRFGLLMQRRQIEKTYLALVWGWPEWQQTLVDAPLLRQGEYAASPIWLKQAIHSRGAPAQTEFIVRQKFLRTSSAGDRFSVVEAVPKTGRTHQIRVHLASLGHPIVGDKIYGPDEQHYLRFIQTGWTSDLDHALLLPRQALHSARLTIGPSEKWESDLPDDLARFVKGESLHPEHRSVSATK